MSLFKFMKICLNKKSPCFVKKIDIALHRDEKIKCTYLLLLLLLYELFVEHQNAYVYIQNIKSLSDVKIRKAFFVNPRTDDFSRQVTKCDFLNHSNKK